VLFVAPGNLYVRDIYVNKIGSLGVGEAVLGYNLWWVSLDPNRNNVRSVEEFEQAVKNLYASLPPDEELASKIAERARNAVKVENVGGVAQVIWFDTSYYVETKYMWYNPQLAAAVVRRILAMLGYSVSDIGAYAISPSTTLLTLYAHMSGGRPLLAVKRGLIEPPDRGIERALHDELGLPDVKEAVVNEVRRMEEKVGYDPSLVPDAPVVKALLSTLASAIVGRSVRVELTRGRSFADTASYTVYINHLLVKVDATILTVRDMFKAFIHEVAHLYADRYFGISDDLTEQHVEAIQEVGARLVSESPLSELAQHVRDYLLGRLTVEVKLKGGRLTFGVGTERLAYMLGVAGDEVISYPPDAVALYAMSFLIPRVPEQAALEIVRAAVNMRPIVEHPIPPRLADKFPGTINEDFPQTLNDVLALAYLDSAEFGGKLVDDIASGRVPGITPDDVVALAERVASLAQQTLEQMKEKRLALPILEKSAKAAALGAKAVIKQIEMKTNA
jgi:hypothetical protein